MAATISRVLSARSRATIQGRLAQLGASAEAAILTPALKLRIGDLLSRAAAAVERWRNRSSGSGAWNSPQGVPPAWGDRTIRGAIHQSTAR